MRKSDETYDEAVRLWPALLDRVKNGMQSSAAPLFCASIAESFDDVAIQVTNVIARNYPYADENGSRCRAGGSAEVHRRWPRTGTVECSRNPVGR